MGTRSLFWVGEGAKNFWQFLIFLMFCLPEQVMAKPWVRGVGQCALPTAGPEGSERLPGSDPDTKTDPDTLLGRKESMGFTVT